MSRTPAGLWALFLRMGSYAISVVRVQHSGTIKDICIWQFGPFIWVSEIGGESPQEVDVGQGASETRRRSATLD